MQSDPHWIPAGVLRTAPEPTRVTLRVCMPPPDELNVAVAVLDASTLSVHVVPVPVQAPDHPANTEPGVATACRVTVVTDV